jgi:hypothetical protein
MTDHVEQIKGAVKVKVGETWKESHWTEFLKEVVWWLYEQQRDDDELVAAATGLMKYGVRTKEDLQNVSSKKQEFSNCLAKRGIIESICDLLFVKYVEKHRAKEVSLCVKSEQLMSLALDVLFSQWATNLKCSRLTCKIFP